MCMCLLNSKMTRWKGMNNTWALREKERKRKILGRAKWRTFDGVSSSVFFLGRPEFWSVHQWTQTHTETQRIKWFNYLHNSVNKNAQTPLKKFYSPLSYVETKVHKKIFNFCVLQWNEFINFAALIAVNSSMWQAYLTNMYANKLVHG